MTEEALVIGAGPAGLAAAAMLRRRGVTPVVLDRSAAIGDSWRKHYDRLHLHTVRWLSDLPGLPIPRSEGKWVSKDGVARYLETYARHHGLEVRLGVEALRIERSNGSWAVGTAAGTMAVPTWSWPPGTTWCPGFRPGRGSTPSTAS